MALDAKEPGGHPVPRDRMKSPVIGRLHCHHHHVARFGAMVGKVDIAQTQVRRTQWDLKTSALACDVRSFLNIMTKRCSSGGAVIDCDRTSLF